MSGERIEMQIKYRRAERQDLIQIVQLIKEAFPPHYIEMMIWGCDGIEKYLADIIDLGHELCDISNYVATVGDRVVCITQMKRNPAARQLCLNYIGTHAGYRKNNIASKLLLHSIANEENLFENIILDVFIDNEIAKKWYSDLGFHSVLKKQWVIAENKILYPRIGYISGMPQSDRCFREYNFSQMTLITDLKAYSVGLLGKNYFRISDPIIFKDLMALSTLAKFAPNRKILLIAESPLTQDMHVPFINITATVQMSMGIMALIQNVQNKLIVKE